jgi:uncharacterized membrane protein YphA (DoxX/SURF4 family)
MNTETLKRFSPLLLRTGIAIVFLWFGFSQLKNPASWTRMIPDYVNFMSPNTIIYMNGIIEIILASLLLIGLFTRIVSTLLGLHLLHIVTIVGYGATGARDFALALATFSIALNGTDEFCLDRILWNNK